MREISHDIVISFNNKATLIYSSVSDSFANSTREINRSKDENVYNMQVGKYTQELKSRLEAEAKKLLTSNPGMQNQLSAALASRINFYIQEFRHRCRSN